MSEMGGRVGWDGVVAAWGGMKPPAPMAQRARRGFWRRALPSQPPPHFLERGGTCNEQRRNVVSTMHMIIM